MYPDLFARITVIGDSSKGFPIAVVINDRHDLVQIRDQELYAIYAIMSADPDVDGVIPKQEQRKAAAVAWKQKAHQASIDAETKGNVRTSNQWESLADSLAKEILG